LLVWVHCGISHMNIVYFNQITPSITLFPIHVAAPPHYSTAFNEFQCI
jgi:hypothetical protein